jgi:pimeloyl-ACP methyl ester carboxylesterase
MRTNFGIGENNSPADYGFNQAEEINVLSSKDGLNLNGWYIPTNDSKKCVVFVHGRTSNRLKTMKYLQLMKDENLDSLYNICLPDLRNSGQSDPSKTFMGYKSAEDLTSYLLYLKEKKNQETFILYGFSQGAMAIMFMLEKPALKDTLDSLNIRIEKLIFDSALSNVYETLWQNGAKMGLPEFYFNIVYQNFNNRTDGNADKLKMSYLFQDNIIPTLMLHSKDDKTTSYSIFSNELLQINQDSIQVELFEDVNHVQLYQDPRYHDQYTKLVGGFILDK